MSELATQFDVHPNQIKHWKDQLLDGVTDVFDDKPKASKEPAIDVKSLHAKIGQLTLENDFLGERLWRTIKYEEVYLRAYDSVSVARESLRRYLAFYNGRRPHSSLDGQTPDQAYLNSSSPIPVAA